MRASVVVDRVRMLASQVRRLQPATTNVEARISAGRLPAYTTLRDIVASVLTVTSAAVFGVEDSRLEETWQSK
jgi:hypothetical protein